MRKMLAVAWLLLAGCATPYQSGGLFGGHSQASGPGRLEKISFAGNAYIDAKTVQQYALYRCAEYAAEKKKPYFVIYDSLMAAGQGKAAELPNVGTVGAKPIAFAFVLTLDGAQEGAKETSKVLEELAPLIKQSQPESGK